MPAAAYDDLFFAVRSSLAACAYKCSDKAGTDDDMDDEVDFWLDPETVLFETSPLEEDVYAATYEALKDGREKLQELVSDELVKTFLSTRDFSVIFSVDDTDDDEQIYVGAVDRSTGVAMIKADNLLDEKLLDEAAAIAKANTGATTPAPFHYNYRLVRGRDCSLTDTQQANAQRRLTALLSEIDLHVLGRHIGAEIAVRDDL